MNPLTVEEPKAMRDMKRTRGLSWITGLLMLAVVIGCGSDSSPTEDAPQAVAMGQGPDTARQVGAAGRAGAGQTAPMGPMPGVGTMTMTPAGGSAGAPAQGAAGAPGAPANGGGAGHAEAGAVGAGGAGVGGLAGAAGSQAGAAGAAGSSGTVGSSGPAAGNGAAGGAAAADGMDPTSVCLGGMPGKDSDAVMTRGMTSSRNFSLIYYLVSAPNKIKRFETILTVPKKPERRSTLFIWPGLQHSGGADPGRFGNGVLQPVLTWGPSCNPMAPREGSDYSSWWISGMYVNVSTGAAGPGGCAGGDPMDVEVGDRLYIDFSVEGTEWTQTVLNLTNMNSVDFTFDLEGQDQNWAIWDIETAGSSRPAEDTYFEKSVLTFESPVTDCQPSSAPEVDYFSAPILSPDGLHCCYEKMILKADRN